MKQLRVITDKCTGCVQCELACAFVQTGTFQPSRSVIRVHIFDEQAVYSPYTCFQCEEAWCVTACPVNAIGIDPHTEAKVVMDDVCVGCAVCTVACPYGTVFYNPDTHKAFKCDLCGGEPACVHSCPTGALEYVDMQQADWLSQWADRVNHGFVPEQAGSAGSAASAGQAEK